MDELATMAGIELGHFPLSKCMAGDTNFNRKIDVEEIVTAVKNAKMGCPR